MVELLGILLALLLLGVGLLVRRAWQALRARLRRGAWARLRGAPLRLSRRIRRRQADRIEELAAELARTRRLLRLAERERDALRAAAAGSGGGAGRDESRFQRAKRAFAMRFHPDRLHGVDRAEARLRRRMFQEYWAVLRDIERS